MRLDKILGEMKLESILVVGNGSWKKQEVGKFEMKFECSSRSWKIFDYFILH